VSEWTNLHSLTLAATIYLKGYVDFLTNKIVFSVNPEVGTQNSEP